VTKSEFGAFTATSTRNCVGSAGGQWCVRSTPCRVTPARAATASHHAWWSAKMSFLNQSPQRLFNRRVPSASTRPSQTSCADQRHRRGARWGGRDHERKGQGECRVRLVRRQARYCNVWGENAAWTESVMGWICGFSAWFECCRTSSPGSTQVIWMVCARKLIYPRRSPLPPLT